MSFVAPWMFVAGIAAALGVVVLHLLSTRRPPVAALPTARFVPESDVRAVARTSKPTDLLLLLLRALAVLLIGLGFAQPVPDAPGPDVRSVVALEWTTALADVQAARSLAQERIAEGDALVLFDTAARVVDASSLAELPLPTVRRAALSPMYVAAGDAARAIARGADSLRLIVLSAQSADALDAATPALRRAWPGRVERVLLAAAADTAVAPASALLPSDANDPLAPALRALPAVRGAHPLRVQRAALTAADSNWLAENVGGVLIHWPRTVADSVRPDGLVLLEGSGATLVAPLARGNPTDGRVMARWRDGAAAVTERQVGAGCLRSVGIGVPESGDLTLRTPFADLLTGLVVACGGRREGVVGDSVLASASDDGPLAAASVFVGDGTERSPLTPWLLAMGLALLIAEQLLRRRQAVGVA
jgi:hypothetical protein